MHPHLSGNAARGTRQTEQKGGEDPVCEGALAAVQERPREVIEGAFAGLLFTAVALQSGLVMVGAPGPDVVALTPRTLEGPIFPAQRMDIRLTRFGVEELVKVDKKFKSPFASAGVGAPAPPVSRHGALDALRED